MARLGTSNLRKKQRIKKKPLPRGFTSNFAFQGRRFKMRQETLESLKMINLLTTSQPMADRVTDRFIHQGIRNRTIIIAD